MSPNNFIFLSTFEKNYFTTVLCTPTKVLSYELNLSLYITLDNLNLSIIIQFFYLKLII